jgi:hypothetical protein
VRIGVLGVELHLSVSSLETYPMTTHTIHSGEIDGTDEVVTKASFRLRLALVTLVTILTAAVSTQCLGQNRPATSETTKAPSSILNGRNPKAEDAITAILDAFDKYEVVGMDAAHGNKDLDDLILHLIREPAFPHKVNDIVVECGNSLYQGFWTGTLAATTYLSPKLGKRGATRR